MPELSGRETVFGIALYNPASAKAVSNTSTFLFMGEGLLAHNFRAWCEVYAQKRLCAQWKLWIMPLRVSWKGGVTASETS